MSEPNWEKISDEFDQDFRSRPNAIAEDIDYETHIIASYNMVLPKSLDAFYMAQVVCIEQSTGTFVPVPEETPEQRRKHVAKVIGVYPFPDFEYEQIDQVFNVSTLEKKFRKYFVQIAYPLNFRPQFPMLFNS